MSDEIATLIAFILFTNAVTLGFLIRERVRRKKIENRLWGIAAAQGLHPTDFTAEAPRVLPRQTRTVEQNRIEQLEAQFDQMAQQMDRLVESQEFLSRVLADRVERPDPRLRTPH